MIIVPEIVLLKCVKNALKYIRKNYADQTDKTKSYLHRLLNGVGFERYDYVVQAVEIFITRNEDHPKYLDVDLMFNMERDGAPTIHITLPAEEPALQNNGMGNDQGYQEFIIESETITTIFTRRYRAVYSIVITGDNSDEVTLIYHVLKALLVAFTASLHLEGIEGLQLGGRDLNINNELMPKNLYFKSINANLEYESSTPNIFTDPIYQSLTVDETPIAEN